MMSHVVGLVEHERFVHAWVLDLPGCIVGGHDLGEIEAKLPLAIAEHTGWLRSHGEPVEDGGVWEIVERGPAAAGDVLFEAERAPMSREEQERLIGRVGFAQADLLAATAGVADAVLDWEPPRGAFETFDAWAQEVRTIRDVARHAHQFDVYYREGLRDGAAAGIYEAVPDPAAEQARTIERLRSLTNEERRRVWRPTRPGQGVAEEWTMRKVVRRMISHERGHAAEILQRRTWVLLGVPGGG